MNKATKYTANGAVFLGIANAIINAIKQLNRIDDDPNLKFNWKEFFVAGGKGALVGGTAGYAIGAIADYNNSLEEPVNTDAFLYSMIDRIKLNRSDKEYLMVNRKAEYLISVLKNHYSNKLIEVPSKLGSTEKGTALKSKFDIDICLCFKPRSFRSTSCMFDDLFSFLEKMIDSYSITRIRDQKKSIGVLFIINEEEYKIDIVPVKISSKAGNKTEGYLFVNDSNLFFDYSSYTKTNIHALKSNKLSETQKKLIIALKHWKIKYDLPLSSHLLENLVIAAYNYNKGKTPISFTKKLIMVLRYIANNLDFITIRSIENTNNILTNIPEASKSKIIDACIKGIKNYEYQPNSIIETFSLED